MTRSFTDIVIIFNVKPHWFHVHKTCGCVDELLSVKVGEDTVVVMVECLCIGSLERLRLAACLLIRFGFSLDFRRPQPPGHRWTIVLVMSAPKNREHWYNREWMNSLAMHSLSQSRLSENSCSFTEIRWISPKRSRSRSSLRQ